MWFWRGEVRGGALEKGGCGFGNGEVLHGR